MEIVWQIKAFEALTVMELYAILRLRSEVFVVEQNCVYPDLDGKDAQALHLFGTYKNEIVAYSRLFEPGIYFENASIGRVVVAEPYRKNQWGRDLMLQSIAAIQNHFGESQITISAQLYLKKFYESLGFVAFGKMYLEDDIPHIKMIKD